MINTTEKVAAFVDSNSVFKNCSDLRTTFSAEVNSPIHLVLKITFLSMVSIVGSFGNLMVIFSLGENGNVYKKGRVFLVNLACADLYVSIFHSVVFMSWYFIMKYKHATLCSHCS